jgi:hypothetical protein
VSSFSIVEDFDIFKDRTKRILMNIIFFMINQLRFHHTEKRLRHSIIPTISLAGHALDKTVLAQFFSKVRASILDTSIRMKNNTFTGRRCVTARFSAVTTISWLNELLKDQPTTSRENKSMISVKYNQPVRVAK